VRKKRNLKRINAALYLMMVLGLGLATSTSDLYAASGTEGAAFLNIPVGARPAALGSAYSAFATDAYAPTWNPGALPEVQNNQLAGQHLAYLESIYYEYASFVHPLSNGRTIGAAMQYLGSGDIPGTDLYGNPTGDFDAHYGAYALSYGQAFGSKLSLGISGKLISAKIDDVGAHAFAVDFGSLYKLNKDVTLAATLTNVGTKLKFIDQGDSLPLQLHLGGLYKTAYKLDLAVEGVFRQTGLNSFHTGIEWRPVAPIALRAGYKTDTVKGLSPLAGFTTGIGIQAWGQEFSYAWLPLGELGSTQYFSLVLRFGGATKKRNLIQYQAIKQNKKNSGEGYDSEAELMELLNNGDEKMPVAQKGGGDNARTR
jgi:hypothetical protein